MHENQDLNITNENPSSAVNASESERLAWMIQNFLDIAAAKSERTVLPKALNRFPINRLGFLSRWILRSYEYLFRDQRHANDAMINALQALAWEVAAQLAQKADRASLETVSTQLDQKADRASLEAVAARVDQKADQASMEAVVAQLDQKADRASLEAVSAQVDQKTDKLEAQHLQRQITDHKYNILEQHRRLVLLLEEARKRLPAPMNSSQVHSLAKEKDHVLDAMYVSFEDRFRGTREDIKERQRVYLPYLAETRARTKWERLVDLGCGRGEWLELLKENDYPAIGVDSNLVMIQLCKERDFGVVGADVLEFLSQQKPMSLSAITSFHLIEHLDPENLTRLLDESLRVLRSGGLIILESPNPENIMVGACHFYSDPTHRNPLPPDTTAFLLEARGFLNVEILRLHPMEETCRIPEDGNTAAAKFNRLFCGPQDYAVIARKA